MSTKKHDVPEELLSGLLANYKKPEDLIGENGLLKQLTKLLTDAVADEVKAWHVRRLEALRSPGIMERVAEGVWKIPSDLQA